MWKEGAMLSGFLDVAKGAVDAVQSAVKTEEIDTGAEFEKRGHKMMEAYYDENIKRWVFPGEDPMAPTEEEKRAQRLANIPPPPTR